MRRTISRYAADVVRQHAGRDRIGDHAYDGRHDSGGDPAAGASSVQPTGDQSIGDPSSVKARRAAAVAASPSPSRLTSPSAISTPAVSSTSPSASMSTYPG